jgi:hypothetical protein
VVDDRHAKKGVVRPSAELGEMAKARMLLRIGQADRALGFNDQADQPFSSSEAHCSNRAGIQTVGRHKDEAGVRRVHEVYGADIHGQMRFDATNDDRQPVVQTDCVAERPGDAVESVKHRQQPARVQSQQYRFECTNPGLLMELCYCSLRLCAHVDEAASRDSTQGCLSTAGVRPSHGRRSGHRARRRRLRLRPIHIATIVARTQANAALSIQHISLSKVSRTWPKSHPDPATTEAQTTVRSALKIRNRGARIAVVSMNPGPAIRRP